MWRRSVCVVIVILSSSTFAVGQNVDRGVAQTIINLERGALDRWGKGDPEGYLQLYARDVTYFDPMRDARVDGLEAMRKALEPIKGLVTIDKYDMVAPHVEQNGNVAILTYNLVTHGPGPDGKSLDRRWNSTAV